MLGATPKVITSASESSSRPKSLQVLVRRAMRPSRASKGMANRMAMACTDRGATVPIGPVAASMDWVIDPEPGPDVDRSEQRRQQEHAAAEGARLALLTGAGSCAFIVVKVFFNGLLPGPHRPRLRLSFALPPFTRLDGTLRGFSASALGRITMSTRDPNLMRPNPLATLQKCHLSLTSTMRRASRPRQSA